jgi:putative addiction module component (TIGR02574 family)
MISPAEILSSAMQLSDAERTMLARQLMLSIENEAFDADSDAAWQNEIDARLAAIESGQFQAENWEEALTRIQRSLKADG